MKIIKTFLGLALGIAIFSLIGCESTPPKNSKFEQAKRGKVFFDTHCTVCHGPNVDKERVAGLNKPPSDLTQIMARRKDATSFPIVEIASYIDGRKQVQLHDRDMPAWGNYFKDEEKLTNEEIKGKMGELIAYLMSIQQ